MTNAVEPIWQAVQQETPNELVPVEGHEPWRVAMAIIAPAEGYARLVCADEARVGDGNRWV